MSAGTGARQGADFTNGIVRGTTPLSLWGGDTLVYRSIIWLSLAALPLIAAVNFILRDTPSWPQLGLVCATLGIAIACLQISRLGRRDIAGALLVGLMWCTITIYSISSGYGMHSAAVFMYLPCLLYAELFFGLAVAAAELALTIAVLVLMYLAEERGQLAGAAQFAPLGANFNFLVGVVLTCVGTLLIGAVYHRRIEREAARVVAEAEQRRLAMEQAREAQAQLQTAHAKLQQLNDELAARARASDLETARLRRDLDLYHDVVSKDFPASLRSLREAIARPDDRTEGRLQSELGRMDAVVGALAELGRHGLPALQRERLDLSGLAQEEIRQLRTAREFAKVRFDTDAGLRADGDRRLIAALLRHLIKRAALACRAEADPLVHFGGGSLDGRAGFFVHDNGPAMDASLRKKLFRPFGRNGEQDDTVDIGIVSARRIVERHGGELVVDSLPNRGTTIFFFLLSA